MFSVSYTILSYTLVVLVPISAKLSLLDPMNDQISPIHIPAWNGLPFQVGDKSFNNTPLIPLHIPHGRYNPCDESTFTKEIITELMLQHHNTEGHENVTATISDTTTNSMQEWIGTILKQFVID